MERCQIRYADNQMPAYSQYPAKFIKDPENFLRVFEHLVGDDKIHRFIRKGERLSFNIKLISPVTAGFQRREAERSFTAYAVTEP